MEVLEITQPGPYCSIQDRGRIGHRAYAIPLSGCLDWQLQAMANFLAGNDLDSSVVEIIGGRFVAICVHPIELGVVGIDLKVSTNGNEMIGLQTISLKIGDEILIESRLAYLSISGRLQSTHHFGSCSSYPLAGLGEPLLQKGKRLSVVQKTLSKRIVLPDLLPPLLQPMIVRIVLGPEASWMLQSTEELEQMDWRISNQSNRIGIRLMGHLLKMKNEEMESVPTFPGTIQLPPNGEPIILMNDAQTTGGYPRIGQVIKADLPRLARMMLGGSIRFKFVTIDEARYIFQRQQAFIKHALK